MKAIIISVLLITSLPFAELSGTTKKNLLAPGAKVETLSEEFFFTEGPMVDKDGNVYYADQPNERIWVCTTDGKLSFFEEKLGDANELSFDREGNLKSCSCGNTESWGIDMAGDYTVLAAHMEGRNLNGTNDFWVHPGKTIYFTDPYYIRKTWERHPDMPAEDGNNYYVSFDGKKIVQVDAGLKQPGAIIGSPDGKLLYVVDLVEKKTYMYDIRPDGFVTNKRLFAEVNPAGMAIDERGNLYLTGEGIAIYSAEGKQIDYIAVDAGHTKSICFGGADRQTLYVTASPFLYTLRMGVKGM